MLIVECMRKKQCQYAYDNFKKFFWWRRYVNLGYASAAHRVDLKISQQSQQRTFGCIFTRIITLAACGVRPSVCRSHLLSNININANNININSNINININAHSAYSTCESPGGSTRRGQRTFPTEYYEDGVSSLRTILWNTPWGDMSRFSIQNGPLRYIISWQITAKL